MSISLMINESCYNLWIYNVYGMHGVMDITYSVLPTQVLHYRVSITLLIFFHILSYHHSLLKTQPFPFISTLYIFKQRNDTLKYHLMQ